MKKIYTIDGKDRLYNTETAKEVGYWWNGLSSRDFNHVSETLYLKRTGEYFLYGEGGPNSKYSVQIDTNSWSGGETIKPLSYEEAKDWARNHLETDEFIELFGGVSEGEESNVTLYIRTTSDVKQALDRKRSETGMTYGELLSDWLGL